MANRKLYFKPINELTLEEIKQLFPYIKSFPKDFKNDYGTYSIATFPDKLPQESDNPIKAYLFGCIYALKTMIPENKLITLFGSPGCGKSHLIRLVSQLKGKSIEEIKVLIPDTEVSDVESFNIKQFIDSIDIVSKKTTRQPRENTTLNNPEILEGISREEVQECDFRYEYSGNLYGFSKKDIDEALLNGNVLMIVNDLETLKHLYATYGNQLFPVYVFRSDSKTSWQENMKKAGRSEEEIAKRANEYKNSINMYHKMDLTFPQAIINIPELSIANTKTFLLQLKRIIELQRDNENRAR